MLLGGSAAAQIFTEDFNSFTGVLNGNAGQNDGQHITTHDMGHSGTLTGWNRAGAGTAHAVDTANVWTDPSTVTANPQNWAVMIWGGNGVGANIINEITLAAPIAGSNTIGTPYRIDFLGAGGVYHAASQVNDGTTDALRIQVLRASDSAVLHTFDQIVAQPTGVGNLGLTPYSFNYTGDGTGDIVFRITGVNDTVTRFQGTIDDLQLSPATSPTLANSAVNSPLPSSRSSSRMKELPDSFRFSDNCRVEASTFSAGTVAGASAGSEALKFSSVRIVCSQDS